MLVMRYSTNIETWQTLHKVAIKMRINSSILFEMIAALFTNTEERQEEVGSIVIVLNLAPKKVHSILID
jgi:hypothetical protein